MDNELHTRLENIERLLEKVLEESRETRAELREFIQEQRSENAKTQALLKGLGARMSSVEQRVEAVEAAVFFNQEN